MILTFVAFSCFQPLFEPKGASMSSTFQFTSRLCQISIVRTSQDRIIVHNKTFYILAKIAKNLKEKSSLQMLIANRQAFLHLGPTLSYLGPGQRSIMPLQARQGLGTLCCAHHDMNSNMY